MEADPILVDRARQELDVYLVSGQPIIEQIGLAAEEGVFSFYRNLDNDHWSSFNRSWGSRFNTRPYEEIPVRCIRPQRLFERYGIPYYLKVDIEGNDIDVARALHDFRERPKYISVEASSVSYFAELWALGCRGFKIVDQRENKMVRCPCPAREGTYVDATFDGTMPGSFGDEAPGEWASFDVAIETFVTDILSVRRGWLGGDSLFDLHGRI